MPYTLGEEYPTATQLSRDEYSSSIVKSFKAADVLFLVQEQRENQVTIIKDLK